MQAVVAQQTEVIVRKEPGSLPLSIYGLPSNMRPCKRNTDDEFDSELLKRNAFGAV